MSANYRNNDERLLKKEVLQAELDINKQMQIALQLRISVVKEYKEITQKSVKYKISKMWK